ncbi:HalOD1 output domain-containing protein [Natrarchaeobaculum aegyptiacum]|uniref:Halobacterial output domain-containing protein n=1 Tax=Natrarchaeobaculum aegyptiacum TaxID=745377 RepID=A0A2Z2HN68_9EURY|nr:HalOD1 output domain-containing protein [Natrarchaeobaculum aegyptiacum]ARS88330.1 hypothetical protein B1756_00175 [Natrarchaeobaculum aegyptiacum]
MTEGRICDSNGRPAGQRVRYDRSKGESPSIAVATALAEYRQEDVLGSSVPLYDHVDPEALDAFFTNSRSGVETPTEAARGTDRSVRRVEFVVDDALVRVESGTVEICPLE